MPPFHYVYLLESIPDPANFYPGRTDDLQARLAKHNEGGNPHTAAGRPWAIKNAFAFRNEIKAASFERYLKSPSGRTVARRHF
jgi:predicted GIY-YIG superfamily endonuclease